MIWKNILIILYFMVLLGSSISLAQNQAPAPHMIPLPQLGALNLNGSDLQVVATTSIIGDIVAQVGGDSIELSTLIAAGQDPHSYEPAARDLTKVARAQVIFVNGWNLEESLLRNLQAVASSTPMVAVSANIEPLELSPEEHAEDHDHGGEGDDHGSEGADPHTWFSLNNVKQWVDNIRQSLSSLDPDRASTYNANALAYLSKLDELDNYAREQIATIPPEKRILVTNHDVFAYFARDYGFEVLGTVIPATSTLAEPSAQDLATLIGTMREHGLCTLFTEETSSDKLAQTVAAELSNCTEVKVIPLYTGALGAPGSGAETFVDMFKSNIDSMVEGLR